MSNNENDSIDLDHYGIRPPKVKIEMTGLQEFTQHLEVFVELKIQEEVKKGVIEQIISEKLDDMIVEAIKTRVNKNIDAVFDFIRDKE